MLKKFSVKNFKGFADEICLDFSDVKNYTFNEYCVTNGILSKAIIYGKNGSGKSNLGLAIFDIVGTLTDKTSGGAQYSSNFQNANRPEDLVEFIYEFDFEGNSVKYSYKKQDYDTLVSEILYINDELVVRVDGEGALINLPGAELLDMKSVSIEEISAVRYVKRNTASVKKSRNLIFQKFFEFVEGMLYFRSLNGNNYIGFTTGSSKIYEDIVKKGHLELFEEFLCSAGIPVKLLAHNFGDEISIGVKFDSGKIMPFASLVSTGTSALSLFFYWLREFSNVKFLFIDEFDAFYHHSLAEFVVKKINGIGAQAVMTTHNTSLMTNNLFRPDACLILDDGGIKPVFRRTEKELREAHNIEKIYVGGGFES